MVGTRFINVSLLALLLLAAIACDCPVEAGSGPRGVRRTDRGVSRGRRALKDKEKKSTAGSTEKDKKSAASTKEKKDKEGKKKYDKFKDGGPSDRACKISQKTREVKFDCKSVSEDETTGLMDRIKFKVKSKVQEPVKLSIEYKQELPQTNDTADDQPTEATAKTKFDIEFLSVVEYQKASSSENSLAYSWEDDIVVQTWSMDHWNEFTTISTVGNLSTFSATTDDGVAMLKFAVASAESSTASPNSMKIDFGLDSFPWIESDSYVALICALTTDHKVAVAYDGGKPKDIKVDFEELVDTIGFTPYGIYTWDDTAQSTSGALSSTIDVIASSPADDTSNLIAFSFVGSDAQNSPDIYWDPEAGVAYSDGGEIDFGIGPGAGQDKSGGDVVVDGTETGGNSTDREIGDNSTADTVDGDGSSAPQHHFRGLMLAVVSTFATAVAVTMT